MLCDTKRLNQKSLSLRPKSQMFCSLKDLLHDLIRYDYVFDFEMTVVENKLDEKFKVIF